MIGRALEAAVLPVEAARLLRREKALRRLALYPALLSLLLVSSVCVLAWFYAGDLGELIRGALPTLEASRPWQWVYVGPGRALFWLLTKLAQILLFAAATLFALLLSGALAAPFREALSAAVEVHVTGTLAEPVGGLWITLRDGGRGILEALARLALLLAVWIAVLVLSILVPIAAPVAPAALAVVTALFATLDYAGHALDRRQLDLAAKARWVSQHRAGALGLGGACLLVSAVPLLNLVAAPILVIAGTLFVLRSASAR